MVVHINDTHPGLAIPELMRLLIDQENMTWEDALKDMCSRTFAYTNHTIMAEALERWPEDMVKTHCCPASIMILQELNRGILQAPLERLSRPVGAHRRAGDPGLWSGAHGQPLRARLPIRVNGVSPAARGNSEKVRPSTITTPCEPQKFIAITNGITHRRWLM